MSHDQAIYQWRRRVATNFPELAPAHAGWLATAGYGIALAGCAAVSAVALQLAVHLGLKLETARQRLRELYRPKSVKAGRHRADFDHTLCFGPLLRWATAGCPGRRRLALAIDPTDLSGRFLILTASVLYRRCAIPVAWHVREAHAAGSWNDRWAELLRCTLLASWAEGHERAWLVLTDLGPRSADVAWYGWRAWIEQGFKRLKSGGWELEKNRMDDPDRVARWLAAVALATLWALETGGGDEALSWAGGLARLEQMGLSLFELGATWLRKALAIGARLPRGRWHRMRWEITGHPSDPLEERDFCQAAQGLPL